MYVSDIASHRYSPYYLMRFKLKYTIVQYKLLEGENLVNLANYKRFAKIFLSKMFFPKSRSSFGCIATYVASK